MLRIVCVDSTKPDVSFPLLTGKTYTVGRKTGDITFPDDSSISRNHAELIAEHPAGNINEPLLTPVLTVIDVGSKFGTYPTEDNIKHKHASNPRDRITISVGDKVRFGLQWNEFQLTYTPLVVLTSSFRADQVFKDKIMRLGGHIVSDWDGVVTHVVMKAVTITAKVVCALLSAKPIVTPEYISDLESSFETNKPVPDPKNYLPPVVENEIHVEESVFYPNPARTALFAGKTFLFCTVKHMKRLATAMEAGGGTVKTILQATQQNLASSEFVIMGNALDIANAEKDSRVRTMLELYRREGKRFIPDQDVGLAALHNSIDKFCNPMFDMRGTVVPRLISPSQSSTASSSSISSTGVRLIPDTQEATQRSSIDSDSDSSSSKGIVNETGHNNSSVVVDDDDDIVECTPEANHRNQNGKRILDSNSASSSGKKRSAVECLSPPKSKRIKDATSSSSSTKTPSQTKTDLTKRMEKTLASMFNSDDSDDEEEAKGDGPKSKAPEMPPDAPMDVEPDVPESLQSQPALVKIVDLKKIQTLSGTQNSGLAAEDNFTFRVPKSPDTTSLSIRKGRAIRNLGTDDVQTVRMSVMNEKTLPADRGSSLAARAEEESRTGTSSGGKKRRREPEKDEESIVEKTRKIDIKEKTEDVKHLPDLSPPPLIKKPLFNPNLSRLETSLRESNASSSAGGRMNFKCFKKVLPKFMASSAPSSGQNNTNNRANNPNNSLRANNSVISLVVRDYTPGGENRQLVSRCTIDDDPFENVVFGKLPILPVKAPPKGSKTVESVETRTPQDNAAEGSQPSSSSSAQRRTSPRKKVPIGVPLPPSPVLQDEENDMWSF